MSRSDDSAYWNGRPGCTAAVGFVNARAMPSSPCAESTCNRAVTISGFFASAYWTTACNVGGPAESGRCAAATIGKATSQKRRVRTCEGWESDRRATTPVVGLLHSAIGITAGLAVPRVALIISPICRFVRTTLIVYRAYRAKCVQFYAYFAFFD